MIRTVGCVNFYSDWKSNIAANSLEVIAAGVAILRLRKYFYDDSINSDLDVCVFLSDQKSDISSNCLLAAGFCNFMTTEIFQR